jgi:hypothetical protein
MLHSSEIRQAINSIPESYARETEKVSLDDGVLERMSHIKMRED